MVKRIKNYFTHERIFKGTSLGRRPITSTMNKSKRRNRKKNGYKGQGKRR